MQNDVKDFSARLRKVKAEKQLTQTKIAQLAGVTQASVSGWLKGSTKMPDTDTLQRLSKALDVPLVWLLYGDKGNISTETQEVIPVFNYSKTGNTIDKQQVTNVKFSGSSVPNSSYESFIMFGDHMLPTVAHNDVVVIDTQQTDIFNGAAYALFVAEQFVVAILTKSISGIISASYTNPEQSEQISDISILGRIVARISEI